MNIQTFEIIGGRDWTTDRGAYRSNAFSWHGFMDGFLKRIENCVSIAEV